jgi:hypothetical protein
MNAFESVIIILFYLNMEPPRKIQCLKETLEYVQLLDGSLKDRIQVALITKEHNKALIPIDVFALNKGTETATNTAKRGGISTVITVVPGLITPVDVDTKDHKTLKKSRHTIGILVGVLKYTGTDTSSIHTNHAISAVRIHDVLYCFNAWGKDAFSTDAEIFEGLQGQYGCASRMVYTGPNLQVGPSCTGFASNFIIEIVRHFRAGGVGENQKGLNQKGLNQKGLNQKGLNDLIYNALTNRSAVFGRSSGSESLMLKNLESGGTMERRGIKVESNSNQIKTAHKINGVHTWFRGVIANVVNKKKNKFGNLGAAYENYMGYIMALPREPKSNNPSNVKRKSTNSNSNLYFNKTNFNKEVAIYAGFMLTQNGL